MSQISYTTYQEAAENYLSAFTTLRETPAAPEMAVRAAGDIPAGTLIVQAEAIADASASMIALSEPYLISPDSAVREGISGQFITQATAELQLATELLNVAEEEEGKPALRTRGARGVQLRETINALEAVMALPIAESLPSSLPITRATAVSDTRAGAIITLKQSASVTTGSITQRVRELGGDIALDLFLNSEWSLVAKGASLVRSDLVEQLDEIKEGVALLIKNAVTIAAKTLLNVYDKIVALTGVDIGGLARKKVADWMEQIKQEGNVDLFDTLVGKFYQVDTFKQELAGWLEETGVEQERIAAITNDVDALAGKFSTLAKRLALLETAVVLAKFIKIPQVLLAIAAIQIALLAVVVYAGFDYIGYKEPRFPNLTNGVGEVVREGLGIQ